MNKLQENIGMLTSKVIQAAMASGLSWDESVAAFGVAAKALADHAAKDGDGTMFDCHAHAQKRFSEGFAQQVQVMFAGSDLAALKKACDDNPAIAEAIMSNATTKIIFKH